MTDILDNPRAVIGGNGAPEPTPYERAQKSIEDLFEECTLWMDGAAIDSQPMADGIANLMRSLGDARKEADAARKVEAKPFDDGKAEVQARYNPLLAKADLAINACKKAQEPWLKKLADEIEAKAKAARELAEQKAETAREALQASDPTNLAERAAVEVLVKDAQTATRDATRAGKATAVSRGQTGRAVHLVTTYEGVISEYVAVARHYWTAEPGQMRAFIQGLVDADIRKGIRAIPGVNIIEDKRVT